MSNNPKQTEKLSPETRAKIEALKAVKQKAQANNQTVKK